jgi:hypothetical protein
MNCVAWACMSSVSTPIDLRSPAIPLKAIASPFSVFAL